MHKLNQYKSLFKNRITFALLNGRHGISSSNCALWFCFQCDSRWTVKLSLVQGDSWISEVRIKLSLLLGFIICCSFNSQRPPFPCLFISFVKFLLSEELHLNSSYKLYNHLSGSLYLYPVYITWKVLSVTFSYFTLTTCSLVC